MVKDVGEPYKYGSYHPRLLHVCASEPEVNGRMTRHVAASATTTIAPQDSGRAKAKSVRRGFHTSL